LLVSVINTHNPSILCLQEALPDQVNYIVQHTTHWNGTNETVAILVEATDTFWLSDQPNVPGSTSYGNNLPRIATWAILTPRQPTRHKGIEQILSWISTQPSHPIIVTGDFNNLRLDSPEILEMQKAGFVDTYYEKHGINPSTFHHFRGPLETISTKIVRDKEGERYPSDHYPIIASFRPVS
ncbi:Endonuclease/exonuclease/phosphatase, partial [Chytridium lagenaria]